jgi:hypothetical protein
MLRLCIVLVGLVGTDVALAAEGVFSRDTSPASMNDTPMAAYYDTTVNDPHAVDLLFREGNTIRSVLDGLSDKGFHIQYKKEQILPTMTLLALPKNSRIDLLLQEILKPWDLKAYHSPLGQWIVRREKKKAEDLDEE